MFKRKTRLFEDNILGDNILGLSPLCWALVTWAVLGLTGPSPTLQELFP